MSDEQDDEDDGFLEPVRIKLSSRKVILGPDSEGQYRLGELREMMGTQRDAYFNAKRQKSQIGGNGSFTVLDFKGSYSDLLARTLYVSPKTHPTAEEAKAEAKDPDAPPLVRIVLSQLDSYPSSAQKQLYEASAIISALHAAEEKKVGEDSEASV